MNTTATGDLVPRIYDKEGDLLVQADRRSDRVILLPSGDPRHASTNRDRIRIPWGQHLLADLLARRYRTLVCGVNHEDNAHGIIGEVADLLPTSQWNHDLITHHAATFAKSESGNDVLVLKYDLDAIEILALLRPRDRPHFTLDDIRRGFRKVCEMLHGRNDRLPCATVSFLGAKSNCLHDDDGNEPSFETVLRTMFDTGFRGDVYPSLGMWELAPTGVFASYPFPESIDVMREGGF